MELKFLALILPAFSLISSPFHVIKTFGYGNVLLCVVGKVTSKFFLYMYI